MSCIWIIGIFSVAHSHEVLYIYIYSVLMHLPKSVHTRPLYNKYMYKIVSPQDGRQLAVQGSPRVTQGP
jgi:hypothetical protein